MTDKELSHLCSSAILVKSLMQGETEQAHAAFKQATAIVQKLADSIGEDERRANFLASPLVRRGLE